MINGADHKLACVTVTYHPDMRILLRQIGALPADSLKIVVDNASPPECVRQLAELESLFPNLRLIRNTENKGLAAALNLGVRTAHEIMPETGFVLMLDQDSEPSQGSVEMLLSAFLFLESSDKTTGAVGPLLRDVATGLTHGFHQCTAWRWKRVYPPEGSNELIPCANLNGSGTLMRIKLFLELGGLNETFFIDHVDTEWSFRLLARGLKLWGIPRAVFFHRMGQASVRYWFFGWRVWPSRSPGRHYFLFRNAITLIGSGNVPVVWKAWAIMKLCLTFFVHLVFDPERYQQMSSIQRGVRDGLSGKRAWNE